MVDNNKGLKEQINSILKDNGISRRDAFKMLALMGAFTTLPATETNTTTTKHTIKSKGKILIIGGGLAGMSTAAKLSNELLNPDITIIEPNGTSVSYQSGQTLISAGIWKKKDIIFYTKDHIPNGVKWIKDSAIIFDPDNNKVTTKKGKTISYDYMVIAAGLKLNYGAIKGLEEVGELYSIGNNKVAARALGDRASSVYFADGAEATWANMQKFIAKAKSGKKVKGIFTHPDTPIKCSGVPKKIIYLTNSRLKEAGARNNAELHFYLNGKKMFNIAEYHNAIKKQFKQRGFKWSYGHNLVAIDLKNSIATFNHHWAKRGEWDKDLEEYALVVKNKNIEVPFDFIHITPPMKAPDEIANSKLGSLEGWVPVEKETLQHAKYKNVFALGDIIAVPMGKTGGSAREQYKIVVKNLISQMHNKPLVAKYDGYTVCPLTTDIGKIMLAEFDWSKKPAPSFPLDPTKERWIWWLLKLYAIKPMVVYGMLSGRV